MRWKQDKLKIQAKVLQVENIDNVHKQAGCYIHVIYVSANSDQA